eukprot:15059173-Alexandrium_andersonii.AAC.1
MNRGSQGTDKAAIQGAIQRRGPVVPRAQKGLQGSRGAPSAELRHGLRPSLRLEQRSGVHV